MTESIVELSQYSLKVGKRFLLKNITWNIKKGENWLLFGLNGCGKTTLLSAIAGYKTGQNGTLKVFGESYNENNILPFRQRFAFVSSSFYDKIYTTEAIINIVLSGKTGLLGLDGVPMSQDIKRAYSLLERFHLKGEKTILIKLYRKGSGKVYC